VKEIKDVVGNRGLKACDYGRYIFLSRWGYQAGYLTEQEAWERILHAAQKVEGLYHSWEDYAAHYILGRMFWATAFKDEYKYGNEAILAYQVISHTENSVWTNSWGGITNSQNENIEQTAIEEILYVPSKSLRAWEIFIEGYRYYQGKLYEEAIDFFQKAFAVDPSITPLLLYIAQSHQLNGEKKKAIQYYLEYKEKNPENYWAHKYLGEAYENNMQIEDGIKEYSIAIGINDKIPEGHVGLGRSMLKQEKYPEAIMALSKAEKAYLERGGKSINYAMYLLGICYFKLHNYNEALSYFLRAYDAYRDNGYINYYLGFCYLNRDNQNVDSAKDYFRRALRMGIDLPPDIMDLLEQSDKDKLSDIILYTG
jgi:tetratricopeptide (TPR) repeat protein